MRFWISMAVLLGLAVATALTLRNEYYFFAAYTVIVFVILATGWNVLGGYAGYVNFGTPAFFGLGVYSALVVFKAFNAPLVVQIAAAALMSGMLGFAAGLLTLRLRGIFFSIATIALIYIMETLFINWRYVGGATGLQLLRPAVTPPFDSYVKMLFVVVVALAIGGVAIARYIERSWIGRGLRAIRDSEEAAEASGVPTLRLKVFACTVSGALMGAAGATMPMYLSFVEPAGTFNLNYAVGALAGAMIGGTAHWAGPVLGAILLSTVQQVVTVTISSEMNVLIVGVLLVVFVVAAPQGIVGLLMKLRRGPRA
jgi:branched-chain amino acid transport system permease protein